MADHPIDPVARREIAQAVLGLVDERGYCRCPGADLHTNKSGPRRPDRPGRDCRVFLVKVPTVYCVHTSCSEMVAEANHKLRSEIAKHEARLAKDAGYVFEAPKPKKRTREEMIAEYEEKRDRALAERARRSLDEIVNRWEWGQVDMWEGSAPLPATPHDQARALIRIFPPEDVVWCGLHADSISREDAADPAQQWRLERVQKARPFRTAREWIEGEQMPGPRICPTAFKAGSLSRSAENVVAQRFLVLEHDKMDLAGQGAVIRWLSMEAKLNLRAVVFTGGKSLHAWFDYPPAKTASELMVLLVGTRKRETDQTKELYVGGMGYDPGCFRALMPYRAPGCPHEKTGGVAELWWLGGGR